jgi:outer membrane protein OmpA-like peptidoglycan-associated protein
MTVCRSLILTLFVCTLAVPAVAQEPGVDDEACKGKDSKLLSRLPGCGLYECSEKEFDATDIVVNMAGETKTLEGAIEMQHYICPAKMSTLQIYRNVEAALKKAGYKVVVSGKAEGYDEPMVTAQMGNRWMFVETDMFNEFPTYRQTAVVVQAMEQQMTATAQEMADAINTSGKLDVYGITFATGQAAISPESDRVLSDVLAVLQANPDWKLRVEGHTDNVGNAAANLKLSQARATAVVAWLTSKGVEAARLSAAGLGDTQPVDDNASDEGRARNRRVVLVKQ